MPIPLDRQKEEKGEGGEEKNAKIILHEARSPA